MSDAALDPFDIFATLRIRGPLGVQRTARTQVDFADPVDEMGGSAELGRGKSADVRWVLRSHEAVTAVTLGAIIRRAAARDRVLLALGGTAWMRRRFDDTLRALDDHLAAAHASHARPADDRRDRDSFA